MGAVEKSATGFGSRMKKLFLRLSATFAGIFAVTKVKAFVDDSLSEFRRFQKGMDEVFTLLPSLSDPDKSGMMQDLRDLSEELGMLTDETVPALYQAISAGVPKDNVFEFLRTAGESAIGGVTDLETAVDGLSSAINAYSNLDVGDAADKMFTAVKQGKTTFEELAASMSTVTPIAASLKIDFGDLMAAVAQLTGEGMATPQAMTYLRQMLTEVAQEGTKASDALKAMTGMSFAEFSASGHDLGEALDEIATYADQSGTSLLDMFGRVQGGQAALMLTGDHMDEFRKKIDEMSDSAGAAQTAYEGMTDNIQHALDKLASWWQGVKIDVGAQLKESMQEFVDWLEDHEDSIKGAILSTFGALTDAFKWIVEHKEGVKKALEVIAGAATVLVGIKIAAWADGAVSSLAAMGSALASTGPIGIAVVGFAAAVALIVTRLQEAKAAAEEYSAFQKGLWEDLASKTTSLEDSYHALRIELEAEVGTKGTTALMQALDDLRAKVVDVPADEMDKAWNDGIDRIVAAFGKKLPKISGLLEEFKPKLKQQGADLMGSLRQGIEDSTEDFKKAMQDVVNNGLSGISAPALDMSKAGQEVIGAFSEGFAQAAMQGTSLDVFGGLSISDTSGSWFNAGKLVAKSFGNGIQAAKDLVNSAVAGLFTASDAKLMGESIGTSYSIGFATGINSGGGIASGVLPSAPGLSGMTSGTGGNNLFVPKVTSTDKKNLSFLADWFTTIDKEGKVTASTLAHSVAGTIASAFRNITSEGLSRVQAEREHQDRLNEIHQEALDNIAEAKQARDDEEAALKQQLADKLISEEEYNTRHQALMNKYTAAADTAHQKEQESLAAEKQAYEDTHKGIIEILKDSLKAVVKELEQELWAKAAAALATALALSFVLSPLAPGKYAEAAAYTAGAAGMTAFEELALAEGGVFQKPTLLQNVPVAEAGYSEAFIPLNRQTFAQIGQGIVGALTPSQSLAGQGGIQVDMRGLYDGATINVRDDQDIRKIARETYTLYKDRMRALGRHV